MSFSLSLHFLPVLGLETSVCSVLKFYPVFWGYNEYNMVFSIFKQRKMFSFSKFWGRSVRKVQQQLPCIVILWNSVKLFKC